MFGANLNCMKGVKVFMNNRDGLNKSYGTQLEHKFFNGNVMKLEYAKTKRYQLDAQLLTDTMGHFSVRMKNSGYFLQKRNLVCGYFDSSKRFGLIYKGKFGR